MRKLLVSAMALVASVAVADEMRIHPNSDANIKDAELNLGLSGFRKGWIGFSSCSAGRRTADCIPFALRMHEANAQGKSMFTQLPDGRVNARWFFAVDRSISLEQMFLGLRLSFASYDGGFYEINGQKRNFPKVNSTFQFGYADGVEALNLFDSRGKLRCKLEFDERRSIFFQDDSRFGGSGFVLRILGDHNLVPGKIYSYGVTVSGADGIRLTLPKTVKITAGRDWLPFSVSAGVKPGSALDFTNVCGIDAPAGKYGRVVAKGDSFEFAGKPGVEQRFYGVNICFGANFYQTKVDADKFAAMLARLGYNALRIHHHDGMLAEGSKDGTTLNEQRLAELDALVAAMIEHGIYVTTDLYVSRKVQWRQLGIDRDGNVAMHEFKDMVRTNAAALENLKRFSRNLLTHVNPYTKRRWADEPGIAWISLVNENCADNMRAIDAKGMKEEVALEDRFFATMKQMIREEIKSDVLLTDLNGWSMSASWAKCREKFDYVDAHFYVDHPRFVEHDWRLPSECGNSNPLKGEQPAGVSFVDSIPLKNKPFTITEWNFSGPGRFRGVGGIVTGAWAATHDWDGLWRFAWSHSSKGVNHPEQCMMNYFDASGDPLMLASERATMCLFLRRDIDAAKANALAIDGKAGTMAIDTERTCGAFAEKGKVKAGLLEADIGEVPATVWVSSLDGRNIAGSRHLLFTHLTDVQNTDATYADDSLCMLMDWGKLPHLMRKGRAEVALCMNPGEFSIYILNADGTRRERLDCTSKDGKLRFVADVGRDGKAASYLYEIVRK